MHTDRMNVAVNGLGAVMASATAVRSGLRSCSLPLRLMHVINYLGPGGTELVMISLMRGLNQELFEHRICALRGFRSEWAQREQLTGKIFDAGGRWQHRHFSIPQLVRIMREYKPHIVHSRNWASIEALLAARLTGVPVAIHSEHGYDVDMVSGMPARQRIMRRGLYALADAVFTPTKELRNYHSKQAWFASNRIRVIYNGVDDTRFAPNPKQRERSRERLGLPRDAFVVGTIGRTEPIKDQATILRAVEKMVGRGVDVRALIVGSGSSLTALQKEVANSSELRGRALFTGFSSDVPDLLNALDAYVLPSLKEGMSNTILEAMASGLPVLATRVGGNPELIEEGQTGWFFEPGDADHLADLLSFLAAHREVRHELGTAARLRVVERFSLNRMLEDYQNLYLEMAERRGLVAPA